jgi:hypothetical protein
MLLPPPSLVHVAICPININVNLSGNTILALLLLLSFGFTSHLPQCFLSYRTTSGCGSQPKKSFLVGFQPHRKVIYIDRERLYDFYIWG